MCDIRPSFFSPQIWSLGEILMSGCVSVLFIFLPRNRASFLRLWLESRAAVTGISNFLQPDLHVRNLLRSLF